MVFTAKIEMNSVINLIPGPKIGTKIDFGSEKSGTVPYGSGTD
jgi:hypothetical protein